MKLLDFFEKAHKHIISCGYQWEIDLVENRTFDKVDAKQFFWEYCFVVLNWGVRNQVAQKDFDKFAISEDVSTITCRFKDKKRNAISIAKNTYSIWYEGLKLSKDPVKYLQSLPCIGKVISKHLARNIGIDCIKPDIWMMRLAAKYECWNLNDRLYPERMCLEIQKQLPTKDTPHYRIGTIDVILWRYCNLTGELT